MAYKNKPYQYLLTFPKGTKSSWDKFNRIAKKQGRPVSELARQVIKTYVKEWNDDRIIKVSFKDSSIEEV